MSPRVRRDQGGQASVELALALPFVVALVVLVVQVGLVVRGQLLVDHAAREGARAAAVGADARAGALATETLDPDRLTVETSGGGRTGERVTVTTRYRFPLSLPLLPGIGGDLTLTGQASMRREGRDAPQAAGRRRRTDRPPRSRTAP